MNTFDSNRISRRRFAGGMAAIIGGLGLQPGTRLLAQGIGPEAMAAAGRVSVSDYEKRIKICYNENPYGPPKSVMDAMKSALEFANRYMAPDNGIMDAITKYHGGIGTEHVILGSGSSEILDIVGTTFLAGQKKVVGAEPTYTAVFEHATGMKAECVQVPLMADYRQDIPAMIKAVKDNHPNVGFVYICNPNNPTGRIVTKDEIKQLLDGIPPEVPVLIDEAYHHFVEDPAYATSVPYVLENRPVIVARTFSKIAAMAGVRLGYAVAPQNLIQKMSPYVDTMDENILAKWGGAAMLRDTATMQEMHNKIVGTRKRTTAALESLGYAVIPSESNFFMVNLKRDVRPVIQAFRQQNILVGRPFPPMNEHLRVSVGTDAEMDQFMTAFTAVMKT